jgi:hypothetical protein
MTGLLMVSLAFPAMRVILGSASSQADCFLTIKFENYGTSWNHCLLHIIENRFSLPIAISSSKGHVRHLEQSISASAVPFTTRYRSPPFLAPEIIIAGKCAQAVDILS